MVLSQYHVRKLRDGGDTCYPALRALEGPMKDPLLGLMQLVRVLLMAQRKGAAPLRLCGVIRFPVPGYPGS